MEEPVVGPEAGKKGVVEELEAHEDLRDLEKAIVENDGKPLVPWNQAKALLDLD